jgi:endonuclease/exonuclease/phosphatase (EEP) superfamily protein YafD
MSKALRVIVAACLVFGAVLTALGVLANWYPALDIVNDGLPFLGAGALALLALAFATRARSLIGAAAILLALILVLLVTGLSGRAPEAPAGAARFLRVVTFNLWGGNEHTKAITKFLFDKDADVVVLQEVRDIHQGLLALLDKHYPYHVGDNGLVILSKYPVLADGRIDRPGQPPWMSLIIRWVKLDVNGKAVELAGVHFARPFYPDLQQSDIFALNRFVRSHSAPLILAGDFNMTPWTVKLKTFSAATALHRFNSYDPTWPMRWRDVRLLPFVPIDNVFASRHFASLGMTVGPYLGSDHRPVVADIALVK